jgi:hypothetical protein
VFNSNYNKRKLEAGHATDCTLCEMIWAASIGWLIVYLSWWGGGVKLKVDTCG